MAGRVTPPNTPQRATTLQGPHNKDLIQIIIDLQKRVARLESRINTS